MKTGSPMRTIALRFLLFKIVQVFILCFTPGEFDTSSNFLYESYREDKLQLIDDWLLSSRIGVFILDNIIDKLIRWDVVHIGDMFVNGIKYEHQFVFCPLWWRLIKRIKIGGSNYYKKIVLGTVIANICHFGACIVLYYLTIQVFKTSGIFRSQRYKIALNASFIYIISPAGIFLTAPYAESAAAFCSFLAIYLREVAIDRRVISISGTQETLKKGYGYKTLYLLSGTFTAAAYCMRSNCILLGIMYLIDAYHFAFRRKNLKNLIFAFASGSLLFFALVLLNWYPYSVFCPARGEWCNEWPPLLYKYAQSYYWGNGFLTYWTIPNIPNFLFAAPTIMLTLHSFLYFLLENPVKAILPIMIANICLLVGGIFWMHTQILTRISSSMPLLYWLVACTLVSPNPPHKTYAKYVVTFIISWNLIQTSLFAAFLPPA